MASPFQSLMKQLQSVPAKQPKMQTLTVKGTGFGAAPAPPKMPTMRETGGQGPAPPAAPSAPPAPPAAPTPPAPTPPPLTFEAYYQSDPRYLANNPILTALQQGIYQRYGWVPDGAGGFRQQSAAENPYSVVNMLARDLARDSARVTNTTNARGLLFSGFNTTGQEAAADAYNRRLNEAAMDRDRELLDVDSRRADLLSGIYPDYVAEAERRNLGATPPDDAEIKLAEIRQQENVQNRLNQSRKGTLPMERLVEMRGWQMDEASRRALEDEIARREANQQRKKKGKK